MSEINIDISGEWAKPVDTLINRIADATGAILQPWQIKRVAKANAEANKTQALANIEITELQQRAMHRLLYEETKKQENIENISKKSFENVKENAKPENINDDWLSNFFDKCKNISDDDMQERWAKILSEEANSPGKFSKKTIEIMSQLEKKDAEIFQTLCSFCWLENGLHPMVMIDNYKKEIYQNSNINYGVLRDLEDLGLIHFSNNPSLTRSWQSNIVLLNYKKKNHILTFSKNITLNVGHIQFTRAGEELAKIVDAEENEEYYKYMLEKLKQNGFSFLENVNMEFTSN